MKYTNFLLHLCMILGSMTLACCEKQSDPKSPSPISTFDYICSDLTVSFTNCSKNATSYEWDFGDGISSTKKSPTHTYSKEGTYFVVLTAINDKKETHISSQNITVFYPIPTASFSYKIQQPLSVVFDGSKSSKASSYSWDFGDGSKSTQKSPTHRYSTKGVYKVTLTVYNGTESDSYSKNITITEPTKCYIKGLRYDKIGKQNQYYRAVLVDDDIFTTTWFKTTYTLLSSANIPYNFIFQESKYMSGLSEDDYYTLYVYWNTKNSGDGTQILKQQINTSEIMTYPTEITRINNNKDTQVTLFFTWE